MQGKRTTVQKWSTLAGAAALILAMAHPEMRAQSDNRSQSKGKIDKPCEPRKLRDKRDKAEKIRERCAAGSSSGVARADFNDDGYGDLAIGAPYENVGSNVDAGAVFVVYGSPSGLLAPVSSGATPAAQMWTQDSPGVPGTAEPDDTFGLALTAGDFNNDGISDLAIGSPGEDISDSTGPGSGINTGSVTVIYGSFQGLTVSGSTTPPPSSFSMSPLGTCGEDFIILLRGTCNSPDVEAWTFGAYFGASLTWGDFDGDGANDLAVGAPNVDLKTGFVPYFEQEQRNVGSVVVLYGATATPLSGFGRNSLLFQDLDGSGDRIAEPYDSFGETLSAGNFNGDSRTDLVVGVPYEDIGSIAGGGMIHVYLGCSSELASCTRQSISQATSGVEGSPEASDLFGLSLATGDFDGDGNGDLAVGVPHENIGSQVNAGAVQVFYGDALGLAVSPSQFWTQSGIFGASPDPFEGSRTEADDHFGWSLAAADFNGDGKEDLAIGVPYEDVTTSRTGSITTVGDAGEVDVLYGSSSGLSTSGRRPQMWHQDTINIEGNVEADDNFGFTLSAWNFGGAGTLADLAIGVPLENLNGISNCGAVAVLYSTTQNNGLSSLGDQLWHQEVPNFPGACESGDKFGYAAY